MAVSPPGIAQILAFYAILLISFYGWERLCLMALKIASLRAGLFDGVWVGRAVRCRNSF